MESVDWQAFLDQHPELTKPTPIDFTDAGLIDALRRAEKERLLSDRRDERRTNAKWPGVYTEEVASALSGIRPSGTVDTGNCIRIGRALGRLERAGKVRKTKAYGCPLWVATDDAYQ